MMWFGFGDRLLLSDHLLVCVLLCSACWGYAGAFYFCDRLLSICSLYSACAAYAVRVYRSLGSIPCSTYLTGWVTHDPSTGVRATTSLRGERAQQAAYSLPSQRFSLALSFPQLSPLLWRTSQLYISHDFSRQISFLCVLCSIVGMCNL